MSDRDEKIDRLLHDAEHAESGAQMADMMRDRPNALLLYEKARKLRADALALDPKKEAPAWTA